ncbi:MAG: ATP-binding protein [Bacteroidales bacterium]
MISRSLHRQILLRMTGLVAAALAAGWIWFGSPAKLLVAIPLILLAVLAGDTVRFLNRVNRRLFFFFDAIRNEDASLTFPAEEAGTLERELQEALTRVNGQIRRIYEDNLRQEQYFQALLEHAATGMFTFNTRGFILHSNRQARQLLGLEPFTHLSQLESLDPRLHRTVAAIRPHEQRLCALRSTREVVQLLMKASAFQSGGEELMLLSVQDIRNELEEKEIDSWRKLIRVMRHEIMNSVTPITSLSESLQGYFREGERVKEPGQIDQRTIDTTLGGLELIHDQARGLFRFVESYREMTRLPEPEKAPFPVAPLLENLRLLAQSFPHAGRVQLNCSCDPEDLLLEADEKQISQVLVNLVKNAYQALAEREDMGNTEGARKPEGAPGPEIAGGPEVQGGPEVAGKSKGTQASEVPRVTVRAFLNEEARPEIHIRDNGPGIPEDLLDKVFIPFFTTREKGSGIGLSLSRQILQAHGGSLKIDSAPGRETRVTLRF